MTKQLTEIEIKARVKELRNFYVDLTLYGAVNLGLILIWAISGGGYFWPIWVIVGWGIGMALKAISLDMIPALADLFPFFAKTWEEQQIKRMMKSQSMAPSDASPKTTDTSPLTSEIKASIEKTVKNATPAKKAKASTPKGFKKTPPLKK
ncbi:MAG: 2TM domain-containing protein [Candidatus Paracaedimonas acanthamoebae]|uniref:2TM domain-containing protein n=1 Tax=Candidatus Paracaedimonas acanthamoebae TaxID=244581 RepID=A0A8J7TTC6_9PROT|nr:2TM domain-containing protein [Candidatus Paracaedimonas acanthamoebae]